MQRQTARKPPDRKIYPWVGYLESVGARFDGYDFTLEHAGYQFAGSVLHEEGWRDNLPARTVIDFASASRSALYSRVLRLRPETRLDRLGKRLGVNREVSLGDTAFDEAVYIESELEDSVLRALLDDAELRGRVAALARGGYGLVVGRTGIALETDLSRKTLAPDHIVPALSELVWLSEQIDLELVARASLRTTQSVIRRYGTAVVAPLLGVASMVLTFTWNLPKEELAVPSWVWFSSGFLAGALFTFVALVPIAVLVRGRSTSFRTLLGYGFVLSMLFMPQGPFWLLRLDIVLDRGPTRDRPASASYELRDDHGVTRRKTILLIDDRSTERRVELPKDLDGTSSDQFVVTLSPGALGWPWVKKVIPVPRAQ